MRWWTFGFHKMRWIPWLVEDVLASQEGLCSMKLVTTTSHQSVTAFLHQNDIAMTNPCHTAETNRFLSLASTCLRCIQCLASLLPWQALQYVCWSDLEVTTQSCLHKVLFFFYPLLFSCYACHKRYGKKIRFKYPPPPTTRSVLGGDDRANGIALQG
jgi:hypothetical protein